MTPVRLQKYLADCGICSRRKAEELIAAGRVTVNGALITQAGTKVDPEKDFVKVGGKPVRPASQFVYILLHKPVGVITAAEDAKNPTVSALVKTPHRVFHVGRLDRDSSGLLLLTNDGELANRLTHPRFAHEKEYDVEVAPALPEDGAEQLARGIYLDGVRTIPAIVRRKSARRFRIILKEGRNWQVRRMVAALGCNVVKLKRVRIENLRLGAMPPGAWRHLTPRERIELLRRTGLHDARRAAKNPKAPSRRAAGEAQGARHA
ncbi:rRNA pseudouridine synthase [bacterium]|nr:rRNA pseudouridine synthase [bacterium]